MLFSTPLTRTRETSTPSLTLRNFSDHEELTHADRRRAHPLDPSSNNPQIQRPEKSICTLITSSSSAPRTGLRQHSAFPRTSRPSVIVYKVATGPNLVGSKDVIRVSYGDGHRKRTHLTSSGKRSKDRSMGRHAYPQKEYGNAKRDDTAKHLDRKPIQPKLCSARRCYDENRFPSAGSRRADTKVLGKLPLAERVEGDMAWDFGAGTETYMRRVDADRSRVRVGGLTSVRMIPRTAVNGEIRPEAAPPTAWTLS